MGKGKKNLCTSCWLEKKKKECINDNQFDIITHHYSMIMHEDYNMDNIHHS